MDSANPNPTAGRAVSDLCAQGAVIRVMGGMVCGQAQGQAGAEKQGAGKPLGWGEAMECVF